MPDTWPPRLLTLLAWALAAGSLTYWVLQFQGARPPSAAPALAQAQARAAEPADVARVFGPPIETKAPEPVVAAVVDPATRVSLFGVVANRARRGVALLSVDGQPARPYRVGASIDNAYTLQSVTARTAVLIDTASGNRFTVALAPAGSEPSTAGPAGIPVAPGAAATGPARTSPPSVNPPSVNPSPGIPMPRFGPIPAASMGRRSS